MRLKIGQKNPIHEPPAQAENIVFLSTEEKKIVNVPSLIFPPHISNQYQDTLLFSSSIYLKTVPLSYIWALLLVVESVLTKAISHDGGKVDMEAWIF